MENLKLIVLCFLFITILSCNNEKQKNHSTIYINNQADFDRYKESEFSSGTHVLFASGISFNGQFAPTGSGTKDSLIKVTSYDPETKKFFGKTWTTKQLLTGMEK